MSSPHSARWDFYRRVADRSIPDRSSSILVVCGGVGDKRLLEGLGFYRVTISNLSPEHVDFSPFSTAREDAEHLTYPDEAFDFTVVHAGLHHCQSPHRALLEMYRVARIGVLVFEARDSLLMRLAVRLGLAEEYEVGSVAAGGHGMRDTSFPNYVYRWTEREVEKTIRSYAPHVVPRIRFFHGLALPDASTKSGFRRLCIVALRPMVRGLSIIFRGQGNLFAYFVSKPVSAKADLQPWLTSEGGRITFRTRHRVK